MEKVEKMKNSLKDTITDIRRNMGDFDCYGYNKEDYKAYLKYCDATNEENVMSYEKFSSKGFSILGHGTSMKNAEFILKEGLFSQLNELGSTACPLENTEEGIENSETISQMLEHWPHRDSRAVVILSIPQQFLQYINGIDLWNSLQVEGQYDEKAYRLSQEFIAGYLDLDSGDFIANEQFSYNPTPGDTCERFRNVTTYEKIIKDLTQEKEEEERINNSTTEFKQEFHYNEWESGRLVEFDELEWD